MPNYPTELDLLRNVTTGDLNTDTLNVVGSVAVSGGATSANQTTEIGLLTDIKANQTNGTQLVSGTVTVVQPTGTNLHAVIDSGIITTISNVVHVDDNGGSLTVDGTVTANAGTGTFTVDGSGVTQPVSGTVAVTQSTSPWVVTGSTGVADKIGTFTILPSDAIDAHDFDVSGMSGLSVELDGSWTGSLFYYADINDATDFKFVSMFDELTAEVSYGAGSPTILKANVAGIKKFRITQPATGSVIVSYRASIASSPIANPIGVGYSRILSGTVDTITNPVTVDQGTSPWVVSGTVTANIGTTGGLALDTTVSALEVAQASTTSGQSGMLIQGATTTAAPSYTTAKTNPLSLNTAGGLRVDGSGVTQPVSGTITANIGTTNGLALDASVNGVLLAQASTTSGQTGPLVQTATTTSAPTYTTAKTNPLSTTTAGALRVDGSGVTQTVSGTVTANAGTGNFTVVQGTGTNLHSVIDSGTITTITNVVHVDDNAGSLTVDGTVTVTQATGTNLHTVVDSGSITATQATGTNLHTVVDSGSITATQATGTNLHTVVDSGSITANAGTNLNTSLLALDTSVNGILLAQGSTTSAQTGPIVQGAVTTNAPVYTTGKTDPISLDTSGLLRVSLKDTPANTNKLLVTADAVTFASPQHVIVDSGTITTLTGITNVVHVDDNSGSLTVDNNGTFAVQASTKTALTPASPTAASVGVASAQIVASNVNRKGLILVNTSTSTISLGLGATAVVNSGITLLKNGGTWVMDEYNFTTGAINSIASAASSNISIQEFST